MAGDSTLSESTVVVATENCLSTTIDDEAVILHTDAGTYYGFNDVGTYIWELLREPRAIEDVCKAVTDEYDVAYERCRQDVYDIVLELLEHNLIQVKDTQS